ncbi:MAG: MFS transporter [Azospira oryzae]|jgi:MFS family permease|nr:MAG: MFS transporter [Azospira oryzae]
MELTATTNQPTERISAHLWIAFVLCFIVDILSGTVSTLMSVYLPVVVKDLLGDVSGQQLGKVSAYINSLFILGWAAGGFIWGMISDRIGRSKALIFAMGSYGTFTVLTGFASSWELVVAFRFLSGFGVGGVLVIAPILLSELFPEKSRSVFVGILSIGFPIGIFSAGLVNNLIPTWRQGFLIGSIPVGIAIISIWALKESEKWKNATSVHSIYGKSLFAPEYRNNLWKGAVIFGSMLIGLWAIFSWLPTWVQSLITDTDGQKERGLSMMLMGAGGLAGGFFSGWLSNGLGVRKAMVMCFSACIVLSFLLFGWNTSFSKIIFVEIATMAVFFGFSQGLLSVYIPQLFPVSLRATATGFCFNMGRLFTAAAVFFIGTLVTKLGGYGNSLLTFSGVFVIGLLAIYFTKDKAN